MQKSEKLYEEFCKFLKQEKFDFEPKVLYEPISYTLALGGKRIRPVMALLGCDFFGGDIKEAMNPAMGIEIFHNFTLLHDDIMDDAPIRRGKETVYKKWNSNIAILSGDTMFALAYKYITKTSSKYLKDILEVFNKTAIEVCEGQQYDMNYETEEDISIDDYMNMIRLKTAVFLGASLKIGAIIAGADKKNIDHIYCFGEYLGMAFQLQDDYLDVFGNEAKFGKKTGGDIVTNKKTYLYLKAFELAKEDELQELKDHFIVNHQNNDLKIKKIKEIYRNLKVDTYSSIKINRYYQKAISHFENIDCPSCNKQEMKNFAERLIRREY
jgi:geranylgeranyl diphosphate synthase type II